MATKSDNLSKKNCYFKDDLAYTEDHRLVYNVFFSNVKKKISQGVLKKYFETFGQVAKFSFLYGNRNQKKYGYVNFVESAAAATVLKKTNHLYALHVRASHTWHQPSPTGINKCHQNGSVNISKNNKAYTNYKHVDKKTSAAELTDNAASILELNDDCLMEICQHLTELSDQIRFASTCPRILRVMKLTHLNAYRIIHFSELGPLTQFARREFFHLFGSEIDEIHGGVDPCRLEPQILKLVSLYCSNVRRLVFNVSEGLNTLSLRDMLQNMKNLTAIEFSYCDIINETIRAMQKLPHLVKLVLCGNIQLTGKYIEHLVTVQYLDLGNCENIRSNCVVKIVKNLKQLQMLNIQNCILLNQSVFKAIGEHCMKLEILKFTPIDFNCEEIAPLPQLNHLEMLSPNLTIPKRLEFYDALTTYKSNLLEYLKLDGYLVIDNDRSKQLATFTKLSHLIICNCYTLNADCLKELSKLKQLTYISLVSCPDVTNDGVLSLVHECVNLKEISLRNCNQITSALIFEAIELLKERQSSMENKRGPQLPLELSICSKYVEPSLANDPRVVAAKDGNLLKTVLVEYDFIAEFSDFDENDDNFDISDNDLDGLDHYPFDDPFEFAALDWDGMMNEGVQELIFHDAYDQFGMYLD